MEQEHQMVQETSLCAKKQQLSKVQRPKALPELTWIVRAVSARSRRELESGKLLGSYVQAQLQSFYFLYMNVFPQSTSFFFFITFIHPLFYFLTSWDAFVVSLISLLNLVFIVSYFNSDLSGHSNAYVHLAFYHSNPHPGSFILSSFSPGLERTADWVYHELPLC